VAEERNRAKEKKAAMRRALGALRGNAAAEKRQYTGTSAPRNERTEAGQELLARPVMEPLSRTERERTMVSTNDKKRFAALVRWSKQRAAGGQRPDDLLADSVSRELRAVLQVQEATRAFRRGESARVQGQMRPYSIDDVVTVDS